MSLETKVKGAGCWLQRHWKTLGGGLLVAAVAYLLIAGSPLDGGSGDGGQAKLDFPAGGPAEFLYLDHPRVVAYLAQIDGGTIANEEQSSKFSEAVENKLTLKEIASIGATETAEHAFTRVVTPTAAAEYFELLFDLEHEPGLDGGPEGVKKIGIGRFGKEVAALPEGQFVSFQTHELQPPVYLSPYLAAREPTTMHTLFPPPLRAGLAPSRAKRQLKRVRHFVSQLGEHPRVIFKLRPLSPAEAQAIRRRQRAQRRAQRQTSLAELGAVGAMAAPQPAPEAEEHKGQQDPCLELQRKDRLTAEGKRRNAVYLMPLDARHLTRERSLIKHGGGDFTVVGKVVRIFAEPRDQPKAAYVDSSTRETWTQALKHAPLKLLCGTDPDCRNLAHENEKKERKRGRKAKERLVEEKIKESRCTDLAALREQTEIPLRGAVILPVAIYK